MFLSCELYRYNARNVENGGNENDNEEYGGNVADNDREHSLPGELITLKLYLLDHSLGLKDIADEKNGNERNDGQIDYRKES